MMAKFFFHALHSFDCCAAYMEALWDEVKSPSAQGWLQAGYLNVLHKQEYEELWKALSVQTIEHEI